VASSTAARRCSTAVSEVKARHGKTRSPGLRRDGSFIESLPGVAKVSDHGQYVEVRLEDGADPQRLLGTWPGSACGASRS